MEKRIVTYSLLAQINNKAGASASHESIFIPLVKRGIAKMCSMGIRSGTDISEVVSYFEQLYDLDMPPAVVKTIIKKIEWESNAQGKKVHFYDDWSFQILDYTFDDFEDDIQRREKELERLQETFEEFLRTEKQDPRGRNIYHFIENGKLSLGKYLQSKHPHDNTDQTIEAKFVKLIGGIPGLYQLVQDVYIGSIISTYLEYKPTLRQRNVELVFDTNFIISLLDLNTSVSTRNCKKLLEISGRLGYRFTVLSITLEEVDKLLRSKIEYFEDNFLAMMADEEDIYNACQRRNLSKTDLDRIRSTVGEALTKWNVSVISHVEKYENLARNSDVYERLLPVRNSSFAALHDATCIQYVIAKRGKPFIKFFDHVNCWFLNNSSSRSSNGNGGNQPYSIKSEDLLNLLWLATPMVKDEFKTADFANIGLSRLVTATLDDSLPKSATIRELDDNMRKYAKDNISDEDIIRVGKSIAERTITNLESLNTLAKTDHRQFVDKLKEVANDEKLREERLAALVNDAITQMTKRVERVEQGLARQQTDRARIEKDSIAVSAKYEEVVSVNADLNDQNKRLKRQLVDTQNAGLQNKRQQYVDKQIRKWRRKTLVSSLIALVVVGSIPLIFAMLHGWDFGYLLDRSKSGNLGIILLAVLGVLVAALSAIYFKAISEAFYSVTAIDKFRQLVIIPDELKEIPYED